MTLNAVLTPAEEGGFVALNPETGTTTQGETVEEALANLREATELYLEEFPSNRVQDDRRSDEEIRAALRSRLEDLKSGRDPGMSFVDVFGEKA